MSCRCGHNGNLYRYENGIGYKSFDSLGGFKSFKTMSVVSEARTYDTLLMMTITAGALYTIRIPVTAAKPVVKLIRKSGWSSFESLMVEHCGGDGASVVVGIDHNTDPGYQYGMSKAPAQPPRSSPTARSRSFSTAGSTPPAPSPNQLTGD